jgi:uncharacterized protein YfaT (DUF1175 family)
MIGFLNKRRVTCALVLWFVFVFLIAYLAWGRTGAEKSDPTLDRRAHAAIGEQPATPVALDSDNDGIPDAAELRSYVEREAFRRWFTHIAEMQYYRLSNQWNVDQRDCAGLVRFAWREALRRHDRLWFQKMGPGYQPVAADGKEEPLAASPLGAKLFRTDFGSYKANDLVDGKFSEFGDARTLKSFNTVFLGRDRHQARPGDLLIFFQPWVQKFPYHIMIFLGPASVSPDDAQDWVVYHTGASANDKGTVKKVELKVLDGHPDPRWRPVESNKNFLGFYRLKILD